MNPTGTNPFLFQDRVVLITGGTSGIGFATVEAFGRAGAMVCYTGRRAELGNQQAKALRAKGMKVEFFFGDVTVEGAIADVIQTILERHGRLDYAFNNAGRESVPTPLTETALESFQTVMDVNVKGVFLAMKHEIPAIRASGGGAIVNTSSVFGTMAMAHIGPYVAAKHAVLGLTQTAALECAHDKIRVNAVCPAGVETDMLWRSMGGTREAMNGIAALHPMGRLAQPDEVAGTVLWLCSDAASFVTGQSIAVDGGYSVK